MSGIDRLNALREQAKDREGKEIKVAVADGTVGVLYQRPRYLRNHRLIPGAIESMIYRYTLYVDGEAPNSLSPDEAQMLLAGATLGDIQDRRSIIAADVFARVKANR